MAAVSRWATCPMCENETMSRLEFCDREHIDNGQQAGDRRVWIDATTMGKGPVAHFHRTCGTCGYEWVVERAG